MKLHRKAKTTPASRATLVQRAQAGESYEGIADGMGISVRTVAKWVRRFRIGGAAALEDGSSRPHRTPQQTPPGVVARIRQLREQHGLPAWAIGRTLRVPRSTVSGWLRRLGLNRRPSAPPVPVQRYEWPAAGDLLHVDIKALGRIAGVGHRIHGDRRTRVRGIGWEYVHVAVDDHSRVSYVEVLADQFGTSCAAFLQRAFVWFAARGVSVRRVMSDNGAGYRSRAFATLCAAHGLRHIRTRAYTPRTNGKAERFLQTLQREWAYARAYHTSAERRAALRPWVRYYNQQRPHASLGYAAPSSRLRSAA